MTDRLAHVQDGIAKFLHGGTYGTKSMASSIESFLSTQDFKEDYEARTIDQMERIMRSNAMPERCFSCSSLQKHIATHEDSRTCNIYVNCRLNCDRQGCDQAREDFVRNFQDLAERDSAHVKIDVHLIDDTNEEMTEIGGYIRRVKMPSPNGRIRITSNFIGSEDKPNKLTIHGDLYDAPSYNAQFYNNPMFYTDSVPEYAKPNSSRLQEQEIAELLELESTKDLSRYGEVAW